MFKCSLIIVWMHVNARCPKYLLATVPSVSPVLTSPDFYILSLVTTMGCRHDCLFGSKSFTFCPHNFLSWTFHDFLMVSVIHFHERSLSLKMTPPHVQLLLIIRWTIHGHEFETASTPPIILLLPSCPESSGGPLGARHFSPSGILFSAAGLVASVVVFLVVVTFWVVVLVGSKFPQCQFEKSWESFRS